MTDSKPNGLFWFNGELQALDRVIMKQKQTNCNILYFICTNVEITSTSLSSGLTPASL